MGLAVEVGLLAYLHADDDSEGVEWARESFSEVNEVLSEKGLPPHDEPEHLPPLQSRCSLIGYPYPFLHYLRRIAAHVFSDPHWQATPVKEGADPADDPIVDEQTDRMRSHLLCHSDCEGFYLPIDFREVLVDDRVEGQLIGSSYRLFEELVAIAPALGIRCGDGQLADDEAEWINDAVETEQGLWIERIVWLSLYEAARLSIQHKIAIEFC